MALVLPLPAGWRMHILVLGASGGVGRWLVRLAAREGHTVTALVRPGARTDPAPGVTVIEGDPLDPAVLDRVVPGRDVIASCLGQRRAGRSAWATLRSPPDLVTQATTRLVGAMQRHGVQRIVIVSAGGVRESAAQCSAPVRWMTRTANVGVAYRDLAAAEAVLAACDHDWCAVRPVILTDGEPTGRAREVARFGLLSTIRRADVAQDILARCTAPAPFTPRTPMIAG